LILVVDDDPFMRNALAREIGSDFSSIPAASFQDAMTLLRVLPQVRGIVCDHDLGLGPSGAALLDVARRHAPELARVLVTSWPLSVAEKDVLARTGIVQKVVVKPWRRGQVRAALEAELAVHASLGRAR